MIVNEIRNELISSSDEKYREFTSSLLPGTESIIGVRLPRIRTIAKKYAGTEIANRFINDLPHVYYEEYMTHALMIGFMRDDRIHILKQIDAFVPYIDNWAVCDSFVSSLKYFYRDRKFGFEYIENQLKIGGDFRIRFALVSLLNYYIDSEYLEKTLQLTVSVKSSAYYVKMAQAWLVSVALAKEYESSLRIIEEKLLDPWVHNKSIQKSKESYRISKERKEYLDSLKIKKPL